MHLMLLYYIRAGLQSWLDRKTFSNYIIFMSKYEYSVVIVTYNRLELLRECLLHCFNQSVPFKEILVVDNNSNDGTGKYLDGLSEKHQNLKILHLKENTGGAGGFYEGLKASGRGTDYILLIDDDAIIDKDYIKNIEPYITEGILAYSGTVYPADGSRPVHRIRLVDKTLFLTKPVDRALYEKSFFDYDISTFCGMLLSARLVDEVGLPIKEYYIWYDDIEYSMRIRNKTVFRNVNDAFLIHMSPDFCYNVYSWKSYYGKRNSWDAALRHSAHPAVNSFVRIGLYLGLILYHLLLALFKEKRAYHLAVAKLHRDVIRDTFHRRLGRNPDYTPEKGFPCDIIHL